MQRYDESVGAELVHTPFDVEFSMDKSKDTFKYNDTVNNVYITYQEDNNISFATYKDKDNEYYIENIGTADAPAFVISNLHNKDNKKVQSIITNGNTYTYKGIDDVVSETVIVNELQIKGTKNLILPKEYKTYTMSIEEVIKNILK